MPLLPAAITEGVRDILLGISAYTRPKGEGGISQLSLDDDLVERMRQIYGGQLQPPTQAQTRWYLAQLEEAERAADGGNLRQAGRLVQACRKDGHLSGVLSTRTDGLVRLPRRFRGDAQVIEQLERRHDEARALFDEMFPPAELAALAADGLMLGVGVGEFVPVRGRNYPVFVRLDPQYLQYIWTENRWYYQTLFGLMPITPGDGRWVLHTPGGRVAPWQQGLWRATGQAWIRKQHAALHKDSWEAKLAHPARVAVAPAGATEEQLQAHWQQVLAWGVNTVFGLKPGYDVKLIESNGRGWESFLKTIEESNREFVIAIAGQVVTTDGGAGFANSDIHRTIRADLIKGTADSLAYTINTQGIPVFIALRFGVESVLTRAVSLEWDVTPPKDRNADAQSMVTAANAIQQLTSALTPSLLQPNVKQLCAHFAIPLLDENVDGNPDLRLIEGGAGAADPNAAAQDSALNGAQLASLLQIVQAVCDGLIPRDAAQAMIVRGFLVDEQTADKLLGTAGRGFVPKSAAPATPPTTPNAPPSAAPEADIAEAAE